MITVDTHARDYVIGYVTISVLSARKLIWSMAQVLAFATQTLKMTRTIFIVSTTAGAKTIFANVSLEELIIIKDVT